MWITELGGVLFKSVIHVDVSVIFYEEQHDERALTSHVGYCHLGLLCSSVRALEAHILNVRNITTTDRWSE